MQDGEGIWQQALAEFQGIMTSVNYSTWLQSTPGISYDGHTLTVGVPSAMHGEYLSKRLPTLVAKILQQIGQGQMQVQYVVVQEDTEQEGRFAPGACIVHTRTSRAVAQDAGPGFGLNPRYVFDTLIVGSGIRAAYNAAVAVAENPGRRERNPLFIWGRTGMHKTQLLHAIGHEAVRHQPHLQLLYVTCEQFMRIETVPDGPVAMWRPTYNALDLLLLDDLHLIAADKNAQRDLLRICETRHEAGRQTVLTANGHPSSLVGVDERLRQCFEEGMVVEVQPPDIEHRIAILQAKAAHQPEPVPDTVIEYIAAHVQGNARELESVLKRIVAAASLQGVPVTLEVAAAVVGQWLG